jgi:hypothetical protein
MESGYYTTAANIRDVYGDKWTAMAAAYVSGAYTLKAVMA